MFHSTQTSKATHDEMWATLSKGEIWKGELINKKKDGTEYIEAALISPVRQLDGSISHYVGIKEDITQQKQADARLHESEQRFRIVADAAPVLIWLADVDKLYFWFNQVWLEFTGRSMAQEAGHGWAEGVHPDDLAHCLAIYSDHFDRRDAFMMEYRLKRHDGEYRWVEDHGVPRFDSAGVFVGYIGSCIDITERYLMRIQLQANNDLLFKLSQQVPGMIYQFQLLPDGSSCFPYASDGIWDIYEVAPDWVSESSEPVLAVLHPDDYDRIMASILESADTLCPWHLEYRVKLPRKGIRWLSGLSRPEKMADGSILWHGFIADITEQRIARNEASQIKKELESVLASATEISIIATDTNGMIQMFNCGAERMLGYRADEMIGKQTAAIIHTPAEIEQRSRELTLERGQSIVGFQVFVAKAMQSGQETREWTYVRKDQSTLIVSLVVTLIRNAQDEISGYLGIAEDITQRKQTEQAMREAKEAAEALVRSKSEFLASMSHEIRTPMNAIIGLSFLALNKELTADTRDYLEKINGASNSLLSILNDILDFSKLEAGEVSIEHHLFNLDTLVDNLSALFVDRAAEQRLDFNIAITPDVPRNLIGDSLRLQQILVNLLGNAIKFTQQGAVTLNISVAHNDPAHVQLLFCVIDTGIGMSDADINKLFKPFSQVDGSITRRFGGTGLGLAISQTLLQKMGGQFLVASTLGQGSCFSFELMFDVSSLASDCKTAPATSAFAFDNLLAGKRILVAEDNLINQQVIREILTLSGITVEMANTGKEALTLLEKGSFDAVLMDVHMPEMDGFEATQFIRSQARFATLPVIALTAGVTKEERGRCMASGMNAFIAKPINPKTLFSTLVQWTTQPISAITARVAEPPSVAYQTSVEDVPVDVPVLDLTYLLAILDDNQALMTQLLFDFMDDMKDLPDDLDALVTAKNWGAVGERIHLIKGVSGTVGAMQLYEATQRLEAELTEEPETASFSAFRAIFQHTMVAITALAQQKEPMPLTSGGNNLERERCAAELDQMLKGNDFITASVLTHFKSHLAPSQFDLFFQLHKLIDQLRYREARAILRQLAKLPDILGSQHD
jgi:PAS domain S-box-containing protein